MSSVVIQDYISGISSCIMLNCVVLAVCLPNIGMCLLSRACELTLLRPLWRLFMSMEHSLSQDPSSITVLLPLHRALSELFFIAEARAVVSDTHTHTQRHTVRTCRPCLFEWDRSSGLWLLVGVCLASWVEGFFFFCLFFSSLLTALLTFWVMMTVCMSAYFSFSLLLSIYTYINWQPSIWLHCTNNQFFYNCLSVKMRAFFTPHTCSALSLGQSRPCHLPGCSTLAPCCGEVPSLPLLFWIINWKKIHQWL